MGRQWVLQCMNEAIKNTRKINLIPSDLVVSGGVKRLKSFLLKSNIILSIILLFTLVIVIGIYFYFSIDLKNLSASVESLKESISSLEASEQKLILAKDKLSKIKKITTGKSINENLQQVKALTNTYLTSSDTNLSEINIEINKMEISVVSKSSSNLAFVFEEFKKMTGFKKIILSSLGYNPSLGYTSDVVFNK